MSDKADTGGLVEHLQTLGIMSENDYLRFGY